MTFRRQWGSTVWGPPKNYEGEELSDCSTRAWLTPSGREVYVVDGQEPHEVKAMLPDGTERTWVYSGAPPSSFVVDGGRRFVEAPIRDWDSGEACD